MAASMPPGLPLRTTNTTSSPIRSSTACTHRNLTRIYDKYSIERCPTCHRIPDLGYLYRCTQDTNGNLPISDFIDEDISMDLADLMVDVRPEGLNLPNTTPDAFAYSVPGTHAADTAVATDEAIEDADIATDELLARAYDGKRKFEIAFPSRPPTPCKCNLKICHTCRPVYKDRAWQSLNNVINNPPIPPSQFELNNRRVSNAAVILSIKPSAKTPFPSIRTSITNSWEEQHPTKTLPRSNKSRVSGHYSWTSTSQPMQNPKVTRLQKHDAHNSDASDADDEKESTRDDESEDSSTDFGGHSETYSEAEDGTAQFHSKRHSAPSMAQGRFVSLSDRPGAHVKRNSYGVVQSARNKDGSGVGSAEKVIGHADDQRVTPGRFVID